MRTLRIVSLVIAVALASLLVVAIATPAMAGFTDGKGTTTSDGATIEVVHTGTIGGGSGGAADCTWRRLADGEPYLDAGSATGFLPESPNGEWWVAICETETGPSLEIYPVGDPAPIQLLIDAARNRLVLPAPDMRLSPPAGATQLVQVPTWLWVDPGDWGPLAATASIPGANVTVTATPVEMRWEMGDDEVEFCAGPGTPYDVSRPAAAQSTDCSHTYRTTSGSEPGDRFTVRAIAVWQLSWVCSPACGSGSLPSIGMSNASQVRVAEAQALIGD